MKYTKQNKIKQAREIILTVENWDGKLYFVKKKMGNYRLFSWYSEGDQNSGKCLF